VSVTVKVTRANLDEALARAEAAEEALGAIYALAVDGGHIPVTWVEHGNGRIGLDACGNITEIELDESAFVVEVAG
jgi:hypothetical protein